MPGGFSARRAGHPRQPPGAGGRVRARRRDGLVAAVLAGHGPLRDVPDDTRHHLEELTLTFIGESLA